MRYDANEFRMLPVAVAALPPYLCRIRQGAIFNNMYIVEYVCIVFLDILFVINMYYAL